MSRCACGSFAINPQSHGRLPGVDLDLCDVCYWRKRAEVGARAEKALKQWKARFQEEIRLRRAKKVWALRSVDFWAVAEGHPSDDWRYETNNGDTRLGYWEWVANRELSDDR